MTSKGVVRIEEKALASPPATAYYKKVVKRAVKYDRTGNRNKLKIIVSYAIVEKTRRG